MCVCGCEGGACVGVHVFFIFFYLTPQQQPGSCRGGDNDDGDDIRMNSTTRQDQDTLLLYEQCQSIAINK